MSAPYCQTPECHDPVTAYYLSGGVNVTSAHNLDYETRRSVICDIWPRPGATRLCGIHARQEFGISFGGRP